MTETFERIVLASRPVGEPTLDNFRLEEHPILQPASGQMLLRTLWLSLDPYMRGRMSDAPSYAKPVGIGEVWRAAPSAKWLPRMCIVSPKAISS
jgi:NADPH-dependent curcumin reductase